jgi:hydroxymethylglutaryl-CoA reductase (NADPH)
VRTARLGLTLDDISHDWVAGLCRDLAGAAAGSPEDVSVRSFVLTELGAAQGVLSRYEPSTREAIVGHRVLAIRWALRGEERADRLVLKAKAPGAVIRQRLEEVYRRFDPRLAELQHRLDPSILDDVHTRELQIYALDRPGLRSITPAIHRVWLDPSARIFAIVMELLEGVRHGRTLDDLDAWQPDDIECAVLQIARVHGEHLGRISATAPPPYLVPFDRLNNSRLLDYEAALLAYNATAFPELFDTGRVRRIESFLASAARRHREIASRPLALIHGDFTPRNVCLRREAASGALRLCAYDWELAQVHLPERDVCELLCYVLNPRQGWKDEAAARLLDRYRAHLEMASGRPISAAEHRRDLALAIQEFCTFKLLVQGITHQLLGNRSYFERLVQNAFDSVEAFAGAG